MISIHTVTETYYSAAQKRPGNCEQDHICFVFFVFCPSHLIASPFFSSCSLRVVTQTRGYRAGSSPPLPITVHKRLAVLSRERKVQHLKSLVVTRVALPLTHHAPSRSSSSRSSLLLLAEIVEGGREPLLQQTHRAKDTTKPDRGRSGVTHATIEV